MNTPRAGLLAAIALALLVLGGTTPAANSCQRAQGQGQGQEQEKEKLDFPTALRQLKSEDPIERGNAAEAMRRMRNKAVPAIGQLIELLKDETPITLTATWYRGSKRMFGERPRQMVVGYTAARALMVLGQPAARALRQLLLTSDHPGQCERGIKALIRIEHGKAFRHIILGMKKNTHPECRAVAATVLGDRKHKVGVPDLVIVVQRDLDTGVRKAALAALVKIGGRAGAPAFITALCEFENDELRRAAAFGSGRIRSPKAVPILIENLSIVGARAESAKALSRIRDRRALEPLIQLLRNFRSHTGHGLRQDPNDKVGAEAIWALRELKDQSAVPVLVEILKNDCSKKVRISAANVLGYLGGAAAIQALSDVAQNEPKKVVRRFASQALEKARWRAATPARPRR